MYHKKNKQFVFGYSEICKFHLLVKNVFHKYRV